MEVLKSPKPDKDRTFVVTWRACVRVVTSVNTVMSASFSGLDKPIEYVNPAFSGEDFLKYRRET
jgi:hypothetical protein